MNLRGIRLTSKVLAAKNRVIIPLLPVFALLCGCLGNDYNFYDTFPSGFVEKEEHFQKGGFRDYTDYCKYYYASSDPFENDDRFISVSEAGNDKVEEYFEDIRDWFKTENREDEYDFDSHSITDDDLVFIEKSEERDQSFGSRYTNYTVFLFDKETNILYYIHNNT